MATATKVEVGAGELYNGYQDVVILGQNTNGETVIANRHFTENDKLVLVFVETLTPMEVELARN